jgi:hypothetical protein
LGLTSAKIQKKAIKEKIQNLAASNIVAIVANLCSAAFIRDSTAAPFAWSPAGNQVGLSLFQGKLLKI